MSTKRGAGPKLRRYWTDEEYGLIQSGEFADAELGEMFGVHRDTVARIRIRLESGDDGQGNRWTPDEDETIREKGPYMSAKQLAVMLGRPWQSVSDRRRKLGVPCRRVVDPMRVGVRRLIAKTCPACGLLLQADWFGQYLSRQGKWQSRCRKCSSQYEKGTPGHAVYLVRHSEGLKDRGRKWLREAQDYTKKYADRNGFPYTEDDHAILRDDLMTCLDKALALHRTYQGVRTAVKDYGYTSKVGLGDATRDQWIIRMGSAA